MEKKFHGVGLKPKTKHNENYRRHLSNTEFSEKRNGKSINEKKTFVHFVKHISISYTLFIVVILFSVGFHFFIENILVGIFEIGENSILILSLIFFKYFLFIVDLFLLGFIIWKLSKKFINDS